MSDDVKSTFYNIGNTYASAHVGLNQTVLREEWGFKGMLETDYFSGLNYGYQTADQAIRGYTDIMLASTETTNHVTDHSATSVIAMRRAAHNILYTAVNSWRYADGEPADPMPAWQIAMIMADVVLGVVLVGLEAIAIRRQSISSGCRLIHTRSRSRNRCRADTEWIQAYKAKNRPKTMDTWG